MIELGLNEREGLSELATDDILVRLALAGKCGKVWIPATGTASYCVIKVYHYIYIVGVTPKKDRAVSLWGTIARHGDGAYIIPTSESWIDWLVENIDCRYRNFSRYLLAFKGVENRALLEELNGALEEGLNIDNVRPDDYDALLKDMWSEDNPNSKYPVFTYADQLNKHNIWRGNSIFYEKADYMALREITLSYNLPKQWTKALQMSNASVYLTGQNLFYITGYDGASPEPSDGFDYGRYPSPRTLIFGLNITF